MTPLPRLYPIVNVVGDDRAAAESARALARAVAAGGATLVQLRAKALAAGALTELAAALVADLAPLGCRLIVNDRVDVALAGGAAGVHLGHEDLHPSQARTILGTDAIVGYSTHAPEETAAANALPVDYLGFGPVFASPTKAGVREPRGVAMLAAACAASELPVVAIGGITLDNARDALSAGAAAVAVIRDLETATDAGALASRYLAL